ncbi:ECF sigma factor [Maioricimonas rarisocia]|uniref:ECF sigma factor n=1 Tax=Maioricimonas rarisocia TaxID=2528026 RepID=A0A517ZCD2_9PLAN|nr:ECF-type sigma factor [Maioricimonas rarisocia]QDU40163.1 ECF sigma factor [Maioricimonas rarisocia]
MATSSNPEPIDVTLLLEQVRRDGRSTDELLAAVYQELRRLATGKLAHEPAGQTLQATALVHEAYLRLIGNRSLTWDHRGHFFAAAAEAMRRILVENARRKQRLRHGGDRHRAELSEIALGVDAPDDDLLDISDALDAFAAESPHKAELVKLRYFAGLSEAEAAEVLGISRATAARWWSYARAWLYHRLRSSPQSSQAGD